MALLSTRQSIGSRFPSSTTEAVGGLPVVKSLGESWMLESLPMLSEPLHSSFTFTPILFFILINSLHEPKEVNSHPPRATTTSYRQML